MPKFQFARDLDSISLCTAAPPLKRKSERSVCDLPLIIVFKDHVTFSGMCGKWFDWLFPIHHYITEIARFDWLSFSRALQSEPSVQNLSLSFATIIWCEILMMSSCVLCGVDIVKTRIQILLMVEGAILLKFERNCCLWSVKLKSIPRTFVGIVFARWRNEGRS